MKPSDREIDILLHTLGLDDDYAKESYRNYFVASDGHGDLPVLLELCQKGLMEECRAPGFLESGDRVFRVTEEGKALAFRHRPNRKLTRAERKYRAFLNISDCYPDLTFRDFLTRPEFAERRR